VGDKVKHRSPLPTFLHLRKAASNEVRPEKDVWRNVVRKEVVGMHDAKSGMGLALLPRG
jgi:hypothetical protein